MYDLINLFDTIPDIQEVTGRLVKTFGVNNLGILTHNQRESAVTRNTLHNLKTKQKGITHLLTMYALLHNRIFINPYSSSEMLNYLKRVRDTYNRASVTATEITPKAVLVVNYNQLATNKTATSSNTGIYINVAGRLIGEQFETAVQKYGEMTEDEKTIAESLKIKETQRIFYKQCVSSHILMTTDVFEDGDASEFILKFLNVMMLGTFLKPQLTYTFDNEDIPETFLKCLTLLQDTMVSCVNNLDKVDDTFGDTYRYVIKNILKENNFILDPDMLFNTLKTVLLTSRTNSMTSELASKKSREQDLWVNLEATMKQIRDLTEQLDGVRKISAEDSKELKESIKYLQNREGLTHIKFIEQNSIPYLEATIVTPYRNFKPEDTKAALNNVRHSIYNNMLGNLPMLILRKRLFENELQIIFSQTVQVNLITGRVNKIINPATNNYNEADTVCNPHIRYYDCFGDVQQVLSDLCRSAINNPLQLDLISLIEVVTNSISDLNLMDGTVASKFFEYQRSASGDGYKGMIYRDKQGNKIDREQLINKIRFEKGVFAKEDGSYDVDKLYTTIGYALMCAYGDNVNARGPSTNKKYLKNIFKIIANRLEAKGIKATEVSVYTISALVKGLEQLYCSSATDFKNIRISLTEGCALVYVFENGCNELHTGEPEEGLNTDVLTESEINTMKGIMKELGTDINIKYLIEEMVNITNTAKINIANGVNLPDQSVYLGLFIEPVTGEWLIETTTVESPTNIVSLQELISRGVK